MKAFPEITLTKYAAVFPLNRQNWSSKRVDKAGVFWYYPYAPDEAMKKPLKSADKPGAVV